MPKLRGSILGQYRLVQMSSMKRLMPKVDVKR